MAMVVKNNMSAKNTLNELNKNEKARTKNQKNLSTGMKINSAEDDASGYAISEKMQTQIRSLNQDLDNTQTAMSMLKVAEGGVQSTVDILSTLKEKVINAANDTNTDADRAIIQKELDQAISQIDENANVMYNGKVVLDGSHNNEVNPATCTVLANESLDPNIGEFDDITDMCDITGRSLGILPDSRIEYSYVHQGKTYTYVLDPVGDEVVQNMFAHSKDPSGEEPLDTTIAAGVSNILGQDRTGSNVYTTHGNNALIFKAGQKGVDGQIAGLTINVVNKDGTINRTANSVLNDFREAIRAENESPDNALTFQIGTKANQTVKMGFSDMRSTALGLRAKDGTTLSIVTQEKANAAINVLELAIGKALTVQTNIGAVENRMNFTAANITTASENTQATESVIRDADMAKEMTAYTKNNVLVQASQSMLAQANQNSSSVLSLLQ
ncbi:flagellin [Selenomonas ruminantium]|uniref:flagellin N-terminal helical domain-containing protein n=1 Tax=Selenomonas ruminantium TaxID=971 RepID=UPI00156A2A82|nr:flagellin [Selenomonas ruminantium]